MKKQWINSLFVLLLIPLVILLGVVLFDDRKYVFISFMVVLLAIIPFFVSYEKREANTRRMIVLAVLVSLSVIGRFIFGALPGFKPVTAIVVIAGIYFGPETGFLVGALSAVISNMYFGQGPWTPFQMFSWGIIGFIAGFPFIRKTLLKNRFLLAAFGFFAGIIYSLMMDVWTVLSIDGFFNWRRYIAAVGLSFQFMAIYAISNVIFLLLIRKPIGDILKRLKTKYGI